MLPKTSSSPVDSTEAHASSADSVPGICPATIEGVAGRFYSTGKKTLADFPSPLAGEGKGRGSAETGLAKSIGLPPRAQARIDAKLALLRCCETYRAVNNVSRKTAEHRFADAYNRGELDENLPWVRKHIARLSAASLQRWRAELKRDGVARLAGKYGNRKGGSKVDRQDDIKTFLLGFVYDHPHASATHMHRGLTARFAGRADLDLPGERAVTRWLNAWKRDNAQTFLAVSNPDAWKNKFMISHGSTSEHVIRLNQLWEIDSSPADLLLIDGRYTLIGVLDVYSRRARLHVAKTSRATAIAALLRRAILEWGVPESARIDNGADYVGHHSTRVFEALAIEPIRCPPFQPWHKPHIERFFRTFAHDLLELKPGFIGHNVAERSALRARKSFADRLFTKGAEIELRLTAQELQEFCDKWVDAVYMHNEHQGEGMNKRTPFETVAAWTGPIRTVDDERALDLLLAEAPDNHGRRSVHKQGIRLKWPGEPAHHWYIAPELEEHVGRTVRVLFDPLGDMGKVYVFGEDGFICAAQSPELTGIDRQEHAAIGKAKQTARVQAERAALREASKTARTISIAEEIIDKRLADTGKVALFRRPGVAHQSAGLIAAAAALRGEAERIAPAAKPLSDAERATHARLKHAAETNDAEVLELPGDPARNYRAWQRVQARIDAGETVTPRERAWAAEYPASPEFATMQRFFQAFAKQDASA